MARVAVFGASGGVGALAVREAVAAGHAVTAQSRTLARLADVPEGVRVVEADPLDPVQVQGAVAAQDAVIYALGLRTLRPTTFFSDTTRILIDTMLACAVPRLIAITGVGAGETRGHGGWFYDRVIFPLVTRHVYADKERQEALIAASGLDWTVLRPAPFASRVPDTTLEVHATVAPDLKLTRISRAEVARLAVSLIGDADSHFKRLFVGHR
jgi:putative NADH-flavin reductase